MLVIPQSPVLPNRFFKRGRHSRKIADITRYDLEFGVIAWQEPGTEIFDVIDGYPVAVIE